MMSGDEGDSWCELKGSKDNLTSIHEAVSTKCTPKITCKLPYLLAAITLNPGSIARPGSLTKD